tara:strand:+ start:1257 stop:1514 length:258 start_codon:yes stop_codon:yes gene_type:complete
MNIAIKKETENVDSYVGELFSFYSGVSPECSYEELVDLANDFMTTMHQDFDGYSIDDSSATAQDYVNYYLKREGLTQNDLPDHIK